MGKQEILDYTQNRELSWLRFNQRVLEEARDETVPLMERMKFVAIFTSNLDEFFMIRVGSLYDMAAVDNKKLDTKSGMTPKQQLEAIYQAVAPLYKERDKTYAEIKKQLTLTNDISATMLKHALSKRFNLNLIKTANYLQKINPANFNDCIDGIFSLKNYGHSSWQDCLLGIYTALLLLKA